MLNMIKDMINQKKDFLEAADLLLEDGLDQLDDMIILGESEEDILDDETYVATEDNTTEVSNDVEDVVEDGTEDDNPIVAEPTTPSGEDDNGDLMDAPIDDEHITPSEPTTDNVDPEPSIEPEVTPPEQPLNLPGDDTLPEPVSSVTGEPVADDNLLSMEIDLGTNTPKDVLPVPPANAADAVIDNDDILNQRIDSGFGEDNENIETPPMPNNEPLSPTDEEVDNDDLLSEAITMADADEPVSAGTAEAPATDDSSIDISADTPGDDMAAGEEDNEVTAAVKDKVAEADSPAFDGNDSDAKEDLMKKLSNITKNLEDAKRAVMSAI